MQENYSLNWDDLKYFLAVARSGTIRGGATLIRVNHTTLARRLEVLEERVGSRLFDRSKTGLVLTELGEALLPYAERVEDEMATASRIIVGRDAKPQGTIHVTMPHGLAMTSIMDDLVLFAEKYPDIDLNLNFTNNVADLTRREADVGFRIADEVTQDVVGRKLVQMSQAAYCTREYAERIKDNSGEGLNFIGWHEAEGETTAPWILNGCYPKAKLKHRVSELVPLISLAAAGLGMAYLACNLGDRHPTLIRAPFQKPMPYRSIWLLLHRDLRNTARVRLFVDFVAERITARRNEFWVAGTKTGS
ncbi:DNA-binding transcriptional regulator, LysR family [Pseudovibrio denitrificans]|uniref:DNA-binding transcriptional regulator, LysR family n=1 Tax=Pseudovibrio denitrificans TaxID=258256 RepID=A0A1I7CRE0_9HYPH|nr:LysR family transcriptional regulator [Pseudovibrio denitrificans]SFU01985.1 DNA-binding transcriptional regulator, LysR family [Pseudovibrio denitrificans]